MSASSIEIASQLDQERRTVSYDSFDIIVRQLIDMIRSGEINISPDYQRMFIWKDARESQLIESILLGIPIPSIYVAVNSGDGQWEVVDGVQRLSTILHFVGDPDLLDKINRSQPLTICGLEKLDTLNGLKFSDVPSVVRSTFLNRGLRVTALNDRSDFNVRFDLFERLNTGGVGLHPQEIRTILFRGSFKDTLRELSANAALRKSLKMQSKTTTADYEEAVLRFFAFLNKYNDFDHSVQEFLNDFMRQNPDGPSSEDLDLFHETFSFISSELPEGIKRSRGATPINLYEAIAVGTALAIRHGASIKQGVLSDLLSDPTLKTYTSAGTNTRRMVTNRINYVRDALL